MPKALRNAALWAKDWVNAAMHDPHFWMMRFWTLRLVSVHFDGDDGCLEMSIRIYPDNPSFRLHHPSEWADWGISPIAFAYPRTIVLTEGEKEAIDHSDIPF